jgi:hypothetical protein
MISTINRYLILDYFLSHLLSCVRSVDNCAYFCLCSPPRRGDINRNCPLSEQIVKWRSRTDSRNSVQNKNDNNNNQLSKVDETQIPHYVSPLSSRLNRSTRGVRTKLIFPSSTLPSSNDSSEKVGNSESLNPTDAQPIVKISKADDTHLQH